MTATAQVRHRPTESRPALPNHFSNKPQQHIHWNDDEWRLFACALMRISPEDDFLHDIELHGLSLPMLHQASQLMPPGRGRRFYAVQQVRPKLLEIYRNALRSKDAMFFSIYHSQDLSGAPAITRHSTEAEIRAVAVDTSNLDEADAEVEAAPPARPASTVAPAAAAAVYRHGAVDIGSKVRWTDGEWCQIAAEIARKRPQRNYLDESTVNALRISDVKAAQHVLPAHRQRHGLAGVTLSKLHPSLTKAFNMLLVDSAQADLLQPAKTEAAAPAPVTEVPAAPVTATATAAAADVRLAQVEVAATAEAAPAVATAAPAAAAPVNPWEAAFKPILSPFISLLTTEVMAQVEQRLMAGAVQQLLAPMLSQAVAQLAPALTSNVEAVVAQQLAKLPIAVLSNEPEASEPAAAQPILTLVPTPPAAAAPTVEETPPAPKAQVVVKLPKPAPAVKRFRIGVYSTLKRSSLEQELVREFKHFDFVVIDNKHQAERLRGCDKVYSLIKYSESTGQDRIKAICGKDVTIVNGSTSSLKRLMHGLAHDLKLPT